jgi:YidC/Oxa1 family membrane protein insertase
MISFLSNLVLQIILAIDSLVQNLGLTMIIFTILFRLFVLTFTYKSLKSMNKMREISGEIKKLQQQHKGDPKALNKAQLELYQKHNINPLSGCLPQILQICMLLLIYNVITNLFHTENLQNSTFLWFDLTRPDPLYIIPLLAVITQLILSLMVSPGGEQPDIIPNNSKNKAIQKLNKKEEQTTDMAAAMQKQMLFMMPILSGFIALTLPSGLGLYWVVSTIFSIFQQYFISGWGGIVIYARRLSHYFKRQNQ